MGSKGREEKGGRKTSNVSTFLRNYSKRSEYGNEIRHERFGRNIHCYRGKFIRWIYILNGKWTCSFAKGKEESLFYSFPKRTVLLGVLRRCQPRPCLRLCQMCGYEILYYLLFLFFSFSYSYSFSFSFSSSLQPNSIRKTVVVRESDPTSSPNLT